MKIKPDQERVRTLLTDTVTLLCKNGLQFQKNLKVQGLLGITLDDEDVFIVHINEMLGGFTSDKDSTAMSNASDIEEESSDTVSKRHHTEHGDGNTHNPPSPHTGRRTPNRKRRRSRQNSLDSPAARKKATPEHDSTLPIKQEPDDLIIIEDKDVKPEASAANETLDSNQDEGLDFALRNLPGDFVPYDHLNTDNRQLARPHIGQNLIPAVPGFPAVSPFITGIVQNALTATTSSSTGHDNSSLAEGSQNQSFHLTQPGTSAWGSETQSALQHWQQREQGAEGTPTQEAAALPQSHFYNVPAKNILEENIVKAFAQPPRTFVKAFRIVWRNPDVVNDIWDRLVSLRIDCDDVIRKGPGVVLMFSCLTGVFSKGKVIREKPKLVYPGIAYWMVVRDKPAFDDYLNSIPCNLDGAFRKAQLKDIGALQKRDGTSDHFTASLACCLKDACSAYIRNKIQRSLMSGGIEGFHLAGRVTIVEETHIEAVLCTVELLKGVNLPLSVTVIQETDTV